MKTILSELVVLGNLLINGISTNVFGNGSVEGRVKVSYVCYVWKLIVDSTDYVQSTGVMSGLLVSVCLPHIEQHVTHNGAKSDSSSR